VIQVYYWPRELRMVMRGHAVRGEKRFPLICAGASALFVSLCNAMNGFRKARWCRGHHYINEDGLGYARLWGKRRYFKRLRVAMGMCVGGLMMMEREYPGIVHVEVCTGIPFDDQQVITEYEQGGVHTLRKFCYDMSKDRPLKGQKGNENGKTAENAT